MPAHRKRSGSPAALARTTSAVARGTDIAIVGRACRLPGASSIAALWDLLSNGRCSVSTIPDDRWAKARLGHPRIAERGRSYTWSAGVLDDIWGFDPAAFGMSPREAEMIDPQQRLLLELTWEALEDAGIVPSRLAGSEAGVFVGASGVDHSTLRMLDMAGADAYMMTGNTLSVIANRISYIFDLHGPSFIIDTACSSALVALNEAVNTLRSGRIDTAIVAGVGILATPHSFIGFSQAAMLSRRGLCQAFSAEADGYVRAEGGVVLVLQTAERAARDGHAAHSLIVASDVNSDGRTNGISLPSRVMQSSLLSRVYDANGIDPADLAFFEAHGTGTPVGDPIEANAIGEALAQRRRDPLPIGSVKSNIGHMEAASGLGGLLKASLALEHDLLPPTLHADTLNPAIDFDALNLAVARTATALQRPTDRPRFAGVNSFGFGGTNAHVVLTDAPRPADPAIASAPPFFILSAHSRAALDALTAAYADRLADATEPERFAIMAAANHKRDRLPHRLVLPTDHPLGIADRLALVAAGKADGAGVFRGTAVDRAAPVAFVFSGNGSQFSGMGLAAYARSKTFRERLDAISAAFERRAGWSIVDELHGPDLAAKLDLADYAQPLLFAIQVAASDTLRAAGIEPAFAIGHSVGEVAAAACAGVLDLDAALATIHARSLHQRPTKGLGTMAVVIGAREAIDALLSALPTLTVAACNSPRAFTLSGPAADIARLEELARPLNARVRKLAIDYPFHSPLMAAVEEPLKASLSALAPHAGTLPFVSTVTGTVLDGSELGRDYWWRNVRDPVLFSTAVGEAFRLGARVFIEIGPNPALLSHIADSVDDRRATVATLPSLEKRDKGGNPITAAVATALARGARVEAIGVLGPEPQAGSRVDLPLYPWQRTSFRLADTTESISNVRSGPWHPLIGARGGLDRVEWLGSIDTTSHPALADHCIDGRVILPGAAFAEMALAVAREWFGTDGAAIADLEITSPMPLLPDQAREVICRLAPATGQLEISSRVRLGHAAWQVHGTAKLVRDAAGPTLASGAARPTDEREGDDASGMGVVDGDTLYARAAAAGLSYGPHYRLLAQVRLSGNDQLEVSLRDSEPDPAFGIDPARLDSCFHAIALFAAMRGTGPGTAYIPVRFGGLVLHRPGALFTAARITVTRCDERIIAADLDLLDAAGALVGRLVDARFQAIATGRAGEGAREHIVQRLVLASEPTATRNDRALSLPVRPQPPSRHDGVAGTDDYLLLEGWATSLAFDLTNQLAVDGLVDPIALCRDGFLPARLQDWLTATMRALVRSGLAEEPTTGSFRPLAADLPTPADLLRTIALEHRSLSAELLVAAATMTVVADLVAQPHHLPPRSLSPRILDGLDSGSAFAQAAADAVVALIATASTEWPRDRAIRLLCVGAGPLVALIVRLAETAAIHLTVVDTDRRRLERLRLALPDAPVAYVDEPDALADGGFDVVVSAGGLARCGAWQGRFATLRAKIAGGGALITLEPVPAFFRAFALGLDAALAGTDLFVPTDNEWRAILRSMELDAFTVDEAEAGSAGPALLITGTSSLQRRSWIGSGSALLVGSGETGLSATLATLLAAAGFHVTLATSEDLDRAWPEAPTHLVFLIEDREQHSTAVRRLTSRCMDLQRLAVRLGGRATTLWLVANGALVATGSTDDGVAAGLWAFSRTLNNEHPSLDVRRIDAAGLDADLLATRLRDLILSGTGETDIRLGADRTEVLRFTLEAEPIAAGPQAGEARRLVRADGSGMGRLHWRAAPRRSPDPEEVEIAVEAIGLNFRDVMFGLGLLPEDILEHGFAGPTLGLECAGTIVRVGMAVRRLKPGDRVLGFARNAFATHVTTAAAVVAPIAAPLSFAEAATIPVAFMTAFYGLVSCARLQRGEWVLIHGGAGGVGLAALQIARWCGARIMVTAGTPERRALLLALGADYAFDSRSGAFVDDVRRVAPDGIAVVLNSLAGEAMERSLGLLRPFGRFVELGKRDYVANTHVGLRPFRRNLTYFGVDLDQLLIDQPAASRTLMRKVMALFAGGHLVPLPFRRFEADATLDAFRLMQQSGHVGKLIVRPPTIGSTSARERIGFNPDPARAHLITGGFGGFGMATARWLVDKGVRHLVLLGRSGAADPASRAAVDALVAAGATIHCMAIDVGDKGAMKRLMARFGVDLPPLAGVIHAAMVLSDGLVANLSADAMAQVLAPKVAGAVLLDELTRGATLDYFLLFSSATTVVGNPGQAAYVAANGFLEGLARRRRYDRLPALAVAWGAIEDVGVLARTGAARDNLTSRVGLKTMRAAEALARLEPLLAAADDPDGEAVVAIAPVTWSVARKHLAVLRSPTYAGLLASGDTDRAETDKIDIAAAVADKAPEDARAWMAGVITDEIARVLRLPKDDIAPTVPLADIGLDSLMAVELALGLEGRFVLNGPISASASSFSVNELADHLIGVATGAMIQSESMAMQMAKRHLGEGSAAELGRADSFREAAAKVHADSQELRSILG